MRAGILEQKGDVEAAAKKWRLSRTGDRAIPGPHRLLTSPATTTYAAHDCSKRLQAVLIGQLPYRRGCEEAPAVGRAGSSERVEEIE